ncbi:MAG TPA: exodeoxyribonuclease VII large subunit [Candidatus Saccharimonadia bacterium]|nr:exodeoxyribonuclease VII large subunit [Candidatus Saccharimonadia bacterium]
MEELVFSVSDFVAVFNQTISYAYPQVYIEGEVVNLKISRDKWLYFSLKDDQSTVRFFGTVNSMPGPLEDGMIVRVKGVPYLHNAYGFSVNVDTIRPIGEGSIKRAAKLVENKLRKEGLFDESRKRPIPKSVQSIGLITSIGSAAYSDFIKIVSERWVDIDIYVLDVQVQGEKSTEQIQKAFEYFNSGVQLIDVIVLIRGGGSSEDLLVFNDEQLTRQIAISRLPTVVAIGHEVDVSLAELVADKRCSTPTHAAEFLTLDKTLAIRDNENLKDQIYNYVDTRLVSQIDQIQQLNHLLGENVNSKLISFEREVKNYKGLVSILNPVEILKKGYSIVRVDGELINAGLSLKKGDYVTIQTYSREIGAIVDINDPRKVKL